METPIPPQPTCYLLRLYNANHSDESQALVQRLAEVLRDQFSGQCQIEIIDVLKDPEKAISDNVFVTPTLVKELPEPAQRMIGDLDDTQKVLLVLGLLAENPKPG